MLTNLPFHTEGASVRREEIEEVEEVSTEIENQGARPTYCSRPGKLPVDRPVDRWRRPVDHPVD